MSEREEVKIRRYDACEMDYIAERENGDYVKYEDYIARLTTAERERDEARRERDDHKAMYLDLWDAAKRHESERDQFASMLHDCMNERDGWKHRAERAERVVEAAKAFSACQSMAYWSKTRADAEYKVFAVVRALDAAEGT